MKACMTTTKYDLTSPDYIIGPALLYSPRAKCQPIDPRNTLIGKKICQLLTDPPAIGSCAWEAGCSNGEQRFQSLSPSPYYW